MKKGKGLAGLHVVETVWERYFWVFLLCYSFAIMLFCTRSSPLYMFNGWVDVNAYFTMGKGLVNGLVPYRDLFDHKGPLTSLLFGLAYLVQQDGFFGVYLLQSLMMGATLCFAYKTLLLFSGSKPVCLLLSLLLGVFVLQGSCYVGGGGSPDEFAIMFEMVSLYYFTRYFQGEEREHRPQVMFLHGVMAACVLLMKFNLVLFWVGFGAMVFVKLLAEKQYGSLLKNLLFLLLGVAAVCLPYLLYALATGSLDDFIEAYFGYNLLYANVELTIGQKILSLLKAVRRYGIVVNFSTFVISVGGIVFFLCQKHCRGGWYWKAGLLLSYLLSLVSIFFSETKYPYVFLPHTVFVIFGLAAVAGMLGGAGAAAAQKGMRWRHMLFVSLLIFSLTVSANGYIVTSRLLPEGRWWTPQQEFAQLMHERRENPTLLIYDSLDHGFYTAADILPVNRFFYKPSGVSYEKYPAVLEDQNRVLREKKVDFVVCRTESPEKVEVDNPFLKENYTLLAVSGRDMQSSTYYLLFMAKS